MHPLRRSPMLVLERMYHFRLSALFHLSSPFSTFRFNIIYGFGVSSMDFWITARQMTTVPHGGSMEYCITVIIRPIPTEN